MAALLTNLRNTVIAGFVLAVILWVLYLIIGTADLGRDFWSFLFRWLHVISGIMWIGLLWYLNFVQVPTMPKIPDELKPAVSRHIAPEVLFWFRWGAMATIITGLIVAWLNGYIVDAVTIGIYNGFVVPKSTMIGIGMWLGAIMWFNVWFVIWPNQKKVLGIVQAADDEKAKAARTALLFSRTNTLLSVPMLFAMVSAQNLF